MTEIGKSAALAEALIEAGKQAGERR
jgi:hypothetical protein